MKDLFSLEAYNYILPEERIAQEPPAIRGQSRLMVLNRADEGSIHLPIHAQFTDIAAYLPPNALLVANNSRVVPARIAGHRASGGKMEMLLMSPAPLLARSSRSLGLSAQGQPRCEARAEVLLRPSKHIKIGEILTFGPISVEVVSKGEFGQHEVNLVWEGDLVDCMEQVGSIPLPPYIKRPEGPSSADVDRYQTIYARRDQSGSVAAPTAGLHFTSEIRQGLLDQGFLWAEVTLHVGYGTFSPVRENDIRKHPMHAEYVEISSETAQLVMQAKKEGRPVIAVGTTASRTLEGMAAAHGGILPPEGCHGNTRIFIYPGYQFQILDGLITNFHLPESSLLMLVSALAGYDNVMAAYHVAVQEKYRFFSYGDAMLIR